jgi:hypothetical protein
MTSEQELAQSALPSLPSKLVENRVTRSNAIVDGIFV